MLDLKPIYDELTEAINEIDEKLDSLDDSGASVSRKIVNDLVEEHKETWNVISTSLINQLSEAPIEIQVGVFYGLVRTLDDTLGKTAKEYVAKQAESAPKAQPLIGAADVAPLQETRKGLYAKIKSLVEMAKTFGDESAASMEMPRRRMGSAGKRGPRALSLVDWYIDDVEYEKIKDIVDLYPQYEKVADFTKALRDAKIDTKNPPAKIEFTLPDGKILVGINQADAPDTDDDETEDGTESTETVDDGTE